MIGHAMRVRVRWEASQSALHDHTLSPSTNAPACKTQAVGTPAAFHILQNRVPTRSRSSSLAIARPSSFPDSGATSCASTLGSCAATARIDDADPPRDLRTACARTAAAGAGCEGSARW